MKQTFYNIILLSSLFAMIACGNATTNPGDTSTQSPTTSVGPTPEELEAARYAYKPLVDDIVPEIRVSTNTNLDFATKPHRLDKWDYTDCSVDISNCNEEYVLNDITGGIKVRGNFTANYEKKPFRFKFDSKVNMLGLNEGVKAKSWVLLADWKDSSMTRNAMAFFLGKTVLESDGHYSSDFRPVHLYLNNEYWGMYLLAEQQQVNKYRIDIAEPEDDYAGTDIGYFFEYDGYYYLENENPDGDPTFEISYNNNAPLIDINNQEAIIGPNKFSAESTMGYTVKNDITNDSQLTFISKYLDSIYTMCYKAVYNNEFYELDSTYQSLVASKETDMYTLMNKYIDLQSLVDMYIISEIGCDLDVAWSSFFLSLDMSKDGNKRLTFEAPWDFDSAFGLINGRENDGFGYYAAKRESANSINPWLTMFAREEWFVNLLKEKWAKLLKYDIHNRCLDLIDTYSSKYVDDYQKQFNRWPQCMGATGDSQVGAVANFTTQKQAADHFKNWMKNRLNFCNEIWGDAKDLFAKPILPIDGYSDHRFEIENSVIAGGPTIKTDETASNGLYASGVGNNNGATFTFTINSTSEQLSRIYMGLSRRPTAFTFETAMSITINGTPVLFNSEKLMSLREGARDYHDWDRIYVAEINLTKGDNTIVLTQTGPNGTNLDYMELYAKENSLK